MSNYQVVILEEARKEVKQARLRYKNQSLIAAKKFTSQLKKSVNIIQKMPLIAPCRGEFHVLAVGKLPYLIFYHIIEKTAPIVIVSVFNTKQNPTKYPFKK